MKSFSSFSGSVRFDTFPSPHRTRAWRLLSPRHEVAWGLFPAAWDGNSVFSIFVGLLATDCSLWFPTSRQPPTLPILLPGQPHTAAIERDGARRPGSEMADSTRNALILVSAHRRWSPSAALHVAALDDRRPSLLQPCACPHYQRHDCRQQRRENASSAQQRLRAAAPPQTVIQPYSTTCGSVLG